MSLALLDTTILSNFSHAQQAEWVRLALGDEAATTPAVLAELRRGNALGLVPPQDWTWLPVLALTEAEQSRLASYRAVLDSGEAECLAVAVVRRGRFFSDDLAARRLAGHEGVAVSGTIGLWVSLVKEHQLPLDAAKKALARMCAAGYRAPAGGLQKYLEGT